MHKKLLLALFYLCILPLLFGCTPQTDGQKENEPQNTTAEITLAEVPQEVDLLYLGRENNFDYFIDPVIPLQQIKVAVDKRASAFLTKIEPFTCVQLIMDTNNPQETQEMRLSTVSGINTHFFCALTTAPETEDAIRYGKEFLNSFLHTRIFPGLSISSYQILDAQLTPLDEENHMFSLSITANLTPEKTEFQQYGYQWSGFTENMPGIKQQQISTLLYYYDGVWGSYYDPENNVPLTDGYQENPIVPQIQYAYQPEESDPNFVYEGTPITQVIYEDGLYSYLSEIIFVITRKSHDGSLIEEGYFKTRLYQYERESNARKELALLADDIVEPKVIARNQNIAYLQTEQIHYPSGSMPANISTLNLDDGQITDIFLDAYPFLITDSNIYLLQLNDNEKHTAGIYQLEISSGGFAKISELPGNSYSPAYECAVLARKIESETSETKEEQNSYLYLLWPNSDYTRQDFYQLYKIHCQTGEIQQIS